MCIRDRGSSIKICKVCEGLADEYPRFAPTMEWDTAAGHAIAKASGAEIYLSLIHICKNYRGITSSEKVFEVNKPFSLDIGFLGYYGSLPFTGKISLAQDVYKRQL